VSASVIASEPEPTRVAPPTIRAGRRRARSQRSFAAVLSGLMAFAALQLGLAGLVEIRMPEVRDLAYARRLHHLQQSLRAGPAKPWTVLMLGSSRVQWAFRVNKDEEKAWGQTLGHPVATFNFGVPGAAPLTELLTWNHLHRDGVRPNLLLIEVLPAYLAAPPMDYGELFLPTDRVCWQDLPLIQRYMGNTRTGLRRDWLESWPMAGYTHRVGLLSLVGPDLLPTEYRLAGDEGLEESGVQQIFDPRFTSAQRLRAMQLASDQYHPQLAGFHLGGPQCQALRELLASCRKEGTPVALVVMPEGPTFRSWYPPGTWEIAKKWLTQMSEEYDAPLVIARDWIDDEEDFLDSHHLLRSGREKLIRRLGREYVLPLLRRRKENRPENSDS
jgi:hypothetical protein